MDPIARAEQQFRDLAGDESLYAFRQAARSIIGEAGGPGIASIAHTLWRTGGRPAIDSFFETEGQNILTWRQYFLTNYGARKDHRQIFLYDAILDMRIKAMLAVVDMGNTRGDTAIERFEEVTKIIDSIGGIPQGSWLLEPLRQVNKSVSILFSRRPWVTELLNQINLILNASEYREPSLRKINKDFVDGLLEAWHNSKSHHHEEIIADLMLNGAVHVVGGERILARSDLKLSETPKEDMVEQLMETVRNLDTTAAEVVNALDKIVDLESDDRVALKSIKRLAYASYLREDSDNPSYTGELHEVAAQAPEQTMAQKPAAYWLTVGAAAELAYIALTGQRPLFLPNQ